MSQPLRVLDGGATRNAVPPDLRGIVRVVLGLAVIGAGTLVTAFALVVFAFVRALLA